MRDKLAHFGGKKTITFKKPHWKWPPQSKEKIDAIKKYYLGGEKKNKFGYPRIVEKFEKNFAKYLNVKYALTTNSGTSSLRAAFYAIGIKPGEEIIAPALTFHATATPILTLDAVPVIADCEPDTGNIDPSSIEKNITKKTRGLVITHLCGHPCAMDKIIPLVKKYKIKLIEDCSHAHGSVFRNKKVGTFGDIGVFSLDNNKLLSAGEGGVLVTNNRLYFERALLVSDFSTRIFHQIKNKKLKKFNETGLGFKHRIHPVSAVIANEELKKINLYINKRNAVLNSFSKKLKKIPGMSPPITKSHVSRGAFFGYRPFVKKEELGNIKIKKFIKLLQAEGMEVRLAGNRPLQNLPYFINKYSGPKFLNKIVGKFRNYRKQKLINSQKFYYSTLSLPTFTFENKELINQYLKAFKKVCNFLNNKNLKK